MVLFPCANSHGFSSYRTCKISPPPAPPSPTTVLHLLTLLPELTFENEFTTLIQCRGSGRGISRRCFVAPRRSKSSVYAAAAPISTRAPRDPLPTTLPLLQFFSPLAPLGPAPSDDSQVILWSVYNAFYILKLIVYRTYFCMLVFTDQF